MLAVSSRGTFACAAGLSCACALFGLALAQDAGHVAGRAGGSGGDAGAHSGHNESSQRTAAGDDAATFDGLAALAHAHRDPNGWYAEDGAGRRLELSIVPALQERARKLFAEYQVPYAAFVAIEPASGRVLAYVSHSSANPNAPDLARDTTPPAASVFKLITSSALLESGVTPETSVCYGGGSSRLEARDLVDNPRRDGRCASLGDALGKSINAVFAKLADRRLDPARLRSYAASFGFGQSMGGELPVPASPIEIPHERLEFARTAAGFWHVHMSPLHAALIAATFANQGQMPYPRVVVRAIGPDGRNLPITAHPPRSVLAPATARAVGAMMLRTVRIGTSRRAFLERGRPVLPGIDVAGKTGSLCSTDPYRAYSWWVGFAPAHNPKIAIASLIVNTETWRIKSSFVAREMLRAYLLEGERQPTAAATRLSAARASRR